MSKFHKIQERSPEEWGEDRMTVQVLNEKDEVQEGEQEIKQPSQGEDLEESEE